MRKLFGRSAVAASLFVAVLCSRSVAHAQHGPGALRLGADFTIFEVADYPDVGDPGFNIGVLSTGLGVNVGYELGDMFVIGGRAAFGYTGNIAGGVGIDAGIISLIPYFEILFGTENIVPFAGLQVGPEIYFADGVDTQAVLLAGGYGGVHIFPVDAFSISPQLWASFVYNSGFQRAGFDISLIVSLTGWIGGGGGTAPSAEPGPPPSYY